MAWRCVCGFATEDLRGHCEESFKSALTEETVYDIAKYGPERGKACSGISLWRSLLLCVQCGLVTAEMGSTTTLIFLTHGQADVDFLLFFQEQEWALQSYAHVVSAVFTRCVCCVGSVS